MRRLKQLAQTSLSQAQENLSIASASLDKALPKDKPYWAEKVKQGEEQVNYMSGVLQNTNSPEEYKNWLYMTHKNQEAERFGKMMGIHYTSKIDTDQIALENMKFKNRLAEQTHQGYVDAGINPETKEFIDESNRPTSGSGLRTINGTSFIGEQVVNMVEGTFDKKTPDQTLTDILIKFQPEPLMYNNPKVTVDAKGIYHIQALKSDGTVNEKVPELKYTKADIYSKLGGADQRAVDKYHQSTQIRVGNQWYSKAVDPKDGMAGAVMPTKEAITESLPEGKYAVKNGNNYDFYTVTHTKK